MSLSLLAAVPVVLPVPLPPLPLSGFSWRSLLVGQGFQAVLSSCAKLPRGLVWWPGPQLGLPHPSLMVPVLCPPGTS